MCVVFVCLRLTVLQTDHHVLVFFNDFSQELEAVGLPLFDSDSSVRDLFQLRCVLCGVDHGSIVGSGGGQGNA